MPVAGASVGPEVGEDKCYLCRGIGFGTCDGCRRPVCKPDSVRTIRGRTNCYPCREAALDVYELVTGEEKDHGSRI